MFSEINWKVTDPDERLEIVEKILEDNKEHNFRSYELERLSDYLVQAHEQHERKLAHERGESYSHSKRRHITTPNRQQTVDKRETSFEGLSDKLESADLVHNLFREDKNTILSPRIEITDEDRENIPFLAQLLTGIEYWEELKNTKVLSKKDAYVAGQAVIALRQDQYIIKQAYRKPTRMKMVTKCNPSITLDDDTGYYDDAGKYVVVSENYIDLFNPVHVAAILNHYDILRMSSYDDVQGDTKYLLWIIDDLMDNYLKPDYPQFFDIIVWRTDKNTNKQVSEKLWDKYKISHTPEYISNLATQRIPRILSEGYKESYLKWVLGKDGREQWKKCNRCGEEKPRVSRFWSRNRDSRDGFYSICKRCRSIRSAG